MKAHPFIHYMAIIVVASTLAAKGQPFDLSWHTVDGGGAMFGTAGSFELSGSIGQHDASGPLTGGAFELAGGFWPGVAGAGVGVPAATLISAVSRKANPSGPNSACELDVFAAGRSDPRQGGVTELRIGFDVVPGGPGASPATIEQATCAAPGYVPYNGASAMTAAIAGNTLVLTFTPGLENTRTYRLTVSAAVTSIAGQVVVLRGLVGDTNSDGLVNATDRSQVVGAWTGGGFSCLSDVNSDGNTNATDRSIVVGAWTGGQSCAP